MSDYQEIMEQHDNKGNRALQIIVQDEMSKMDENFDKITSVNPVIKALHNYMETEGLNHLMHKGGQINPKWLAERLGFTVQQIKEAMSIYGLYLKQVFINAEKRFPGQTPWKKFENVQPGRG